MGNKSLVTLLSLTKMSPGFEADVTSSKKYQVFSWGFYLHQLEATSLTISALLTTLPCEATSAEANPQTLDMGFSSLATEPRALRCNTGQPLEGTGAMRPSEF